MKRDRELLQILCPFGEWPHRKGLQIVDEQSAEMMKRNVSWLPMSGIPIYIGHPDDDKQCGKTAAVGRVKKNLFNQRRRRCCRGLPAGNIRKNHKRRIYGDVSKMANAAIGRRQIPPDKTHFNRAYKQPEHRVERKNSKGFRQSRKFKARSSAGSRNKKTALAIRSVGGRMRGGSLEIGGGNPLPENIRKNCRQKIAGRRRKYRRGNSALPTWRDGKREKRQTRRTIYQKFRRAEKQPF